MGSIRPARPSDLDAVAGIQGSWSSLPRWSREHLEAELAPPGGLFVYEDAEGVAGFAALRVVRPEAEVTVVAVAPGRLRRGIARRLLERLHRHAAESGCALVGLEVSAANAAAIALYSSLGYRTVGRRRRYYSDGSDALLMSLHLGPSAGKIL